jgi:hypothetical protein
MVSNLNHPFMPIPAATDTNLSLGMVEECNWNPECVATWDANKAAFPSLSEEDQAKAIAAHEATLKQKSDTEDAEKAAGEREAAEKKAAELREACAQQANGGAAPPQEVLAQPAEEQKQTQSTDTQETNAKEEGAQVAHTDPRRMRRRGLGNSG